MDGGSTDTTINIIQKYKKNICFWHSKSDKGIYDAMNKGIDKARGEWINFMNAGDSFVSNDTISYMMSNVKQEADIITGDRFSIYENSDTKVFNKAGGINSLIDHGMPSGHQSMFIKAHLMKSYKYSLLYKYASDHDLMLRLYADNKKFQFVDKAISNYLRGGVSDKNNLDVCIEVLYLLSKYKLNNRNLKSSVFYNHLVNLHPPTTTNNGANMLFARQFGKLHDQIIQIFSTYNNIILYGNGKVTSTILHFSTEKIKAILDINSKKIENFSIPVYHPRELNFLKYDIVLITTIGREEEVKTFLLKNTNVNIRKLISLNINNVY